MVESLPGERTAGCGVAGAPQGQANPYTRCMPVALAALRFANSLVPIDKRQPGTKAARPALTAICQRWQGLPRPAA